MKLNLNISPVLPPSLDVVGIPITSEDMESPKTNKILRQYGVSQKQLKELGFKGQKGETQFLTPIIAENKPPAKSKSTTKNKGATKNKSAAKNRAQVVLAIGVGKRAKISPAVIRNAAAKLVKSAKSFKSAGSHLLDVVSSKDYLAAAQAHGEGAVLGLYEFGEYKSKTEDPNLKRVLVAAASQPEALKALKDGQNIGEAVALARDFVNEPGGSLTPRVFATRAQAMARKVGLQSKVMNLLAIKNTNMGGLMGVNRGSSQEPRFVELTYTPKGTPKGHLALVGKGVTFDSGGLSLKPANAMMTMKCDMSGAAAVLGAMSVIPSLKLPIKVSAYIPMTDNMTGGDATRPGDVLKTHNKKTVEVLNTDAEGRLILADALSVASNDKPDAIVDLATLTGACVVALGNDIAGVLGNNSNWTKQVVQSSEQTNERVWELPLVEEYRPQLDSTVADLKNIGSNYGGTITAALFLQEFVGKDIPWAHIDIAGPAFKENSNAAGATGFGVRLLVDLAANFVKPSKK